MHPQFILKTEIQYARLGDTETWDSVNMANRVCQKWIKLGLEVFFYRKNFTESNEL